MEKLELSKGEVQATGRDKKTGTEDASRLVYKPSISSSSVLHGDLSGWEGLNYFVLCNWITGQLGIQEWNHTFVIHIFSFKDIILAFKKNMYVCVWMWYVCVHIQDQLH